MVRAILLGVAFATIALLAAPALDASASANDGQAYGWGGNEGGGYGDCNSNTFCGQTGVDAGRYILSPVAIAALPDVIALGSGTFHSLAVRSDGSVWAWGNNGAGQLGSAGAAGAYSVVPLQVPGIQGAVAVTGGFNHSLALLSDGSVWVWGSGFIGTGIPYASFSPPVQIPNLVNITQLAAGESWSYAVRSDGTLWSWGFNGNGQLGDGTATNRLTPVQVTGLSGVVAVASHFAHALALRSDGTVWAWGYNNSGQLGDGTVVERHAPVQVAGLSDVVAIGTGAFHSVALKRDGTVWAWGWNPNGLLGIGSTGFTQLVPAQVLGINAVAEITVGGFHTIAKKSDGSLWAWGWNSWGQLGLGTQTTSESMPTAVGGLSSIGPFVAGRIHSLAAKQAISFASFSAKVEISSSGSFEMNGTFALGSGSTGINPVTQPVTLQVGNFTAKIPAGSFLQNPRGHFVFEGFIDAVALEVNIVPLTDNTFAFRAEGVEANNLPTTNPVNVGLSIGNNVGTTMVTAEIE